MGDILEEVALRVRAVNAPPVIDEDVENAEDDDQERGGPLRLETDGDHRACCETDQGHEDTTDAPFTAEGEADEEEDKQDTARQEETASGSWVRIEVACTQQTGDILFLAVGLAQ